MVSVVPWKIDPRGEDSRVIVPSSLRRNKRKTEIL